MAETILMGMYELAKQVLPQLVVILAMFIGVVIGKWK
tara:strand:+ start:3611 stop:3721 length:111 start_codon:yes stop_codon:yes gene_type:complete